MEYKEVKAQQFSKKKSHDIKFKKNMEKYYLTQCEEGFRDEREKIKRFTNTKPKRSSSGGGAPRNRLQVGNSGKTLGCSYCFVALNTMIQKRDANKKDIKHEIDLGLKFDSKP